MSDARAEPVSVDTEPLLLLTGWVSVAIEALFGEAGHWDQAWREDMAAVVSINMAEATSRADINTVDTEVNYGMDRSGSPALHAD